MSPTIYLIIFALIITHSLAESVLYQSRVFNYLVFVVAGVMAIQTLAMFNQAFAITRLDIVTNFFMMLLTSNIGSFEYILARYLVYISIVLLQAIYLIFLTFILTSYLPTIVSFFYLSIFLVMGLTIWFNLGTICGLYIRNELTRDIVMMLVTTPSIFASSSLYTLDNAPIALKIISYINPLTYISDSVRNTYLQLSIRLDTTLVLSALVIVTSLLMYLSIRSYTIK